MVGAARRRLASACARAFAGTVLGTRLDCGRTVRGRGHIDCTADRHVGGGDNIRERGSVLSSGMAQECWDFAKLAIA